MDNPREQDTNREADGKPPPGQQGAQYVAQGARALVELAKAIDLAIDKDAPVADQLALQLAAYALRGVAHPKGPDASRLVRALSILRGKRAAIADADDGIKLAAASWASDPEREAAPSGSGDLWADDDAWNESLTLHARRELASGVSSACTTTPSKDEAADLIARQREAKPVGRPKKGESRDKRIDRLASLACVLGRESANTDDSGESVLIQLKQRKALKRKRNK